MKTDWCRAFVFLLLWSAASLSSTAAADSTAITSIRLAGTNVVITATVPPGTRRITLECRERLGDRAWEPRAIVRVSGSTNSVTFAVPRSAQMELMRIRSDATETLPANFYSGTSTFASVSSSGGGPEVLFRADGSPTAVPTDSSSTREVVESDIWKIRGDRLYFFNSLRGLQIIDISNPDQSVTRGGLALPASGQDLYVLSDTHAVLLVGDNCSWGETGFESQALVVALSNDIPRPIASLPVPGRIQNSRLVGTALYIASETYQPSRTNANVWEWGTQVSSFDLANPNAPIARNSFWHPGYGNVVAANDTFLFVITQHPTNWNVSVIRCIDITSANGTIRDYGSVTTVGRIADKFKLNWSAGVLTTVSQAASNNIVSTRVETFRVPHPLSTIPLGIAKLGDLAVAPREQLFATRFDSNRLYVVTFGTIIRIDPLWVIDLSDPQRPKVSGELEVPGFSTYLQPMGDRIVAIGVETNRVSVSLFDVANLAAPKQLSRVQLGAQFSWSEANSTEKAFNVLPEAGLILVPFFSSGSNATQTGVQLIDLGRNTLQLRGVIEQSIQPRRVAMHRQRVLSLSEWELLSVNVNDRDHPLIAGRLPLAWNVDRVFVAGNYLLEIESGNYWDLATAPRLRVAPTSDPDATLSSVALSNSAVIGATVRGDYLYLLQGQDAGSGAVPYLAFDASSIPGPTNANIVLLTVFDLRQLPSLTLTGQTAAKVSPEFRLGEQQALWPRADTLVWASSQQSYGWPYPIYAGGPIAVDVAFIRPVWWWYGGDNGAVAFNVGNPAVPEFASAITISNASSLSTAFATNDLLFVSHNTYEFISSTNSVTMDQTGARVDSLFYWPGSWIRHSFLDVIDYTNAKDPLVRKPVSLPGTLHGISHGGELLYTIGGALVSGTNAPVNSGEYLHVAAYDGTAAHLVDSTPLNDWSHSLRVLGTNVVLARAADGTNSRPALETWTVSSVGKLVRLGSVSVTETINSLMSVPGMVVTLDYGNTVRLFDSSRPELLVPIAERKLSRCLYPNLQNATGNRAQGIFLPLGIYGVTSVPTTAAAPIPRIVPVK